MKRYLLFAFALAMLHSCQEVTGSDPEEIADVDPHITNLKHPSDPACVAAARRSAHTVMRYRRAVWRVRRLGQDAVQHAVTVFAEVTDAHGQMIARCAGTDPTYTIGGSLSGLAPNNTIVMQNNGTDELSLTTDGSFAFATPLADGVTYNVTVAVQPADQSCTVSNGSGAIAGSDVTSVQVECVDTPGTIVVPTNPGDLVISEFLSNPAAVTDAAGEWFEIYNPTTSALELNGLVIRDDGSDQFAIDVSLIIQPNGYIVLGANADQTANGGAAVDFAYGGFTLANTSDEIELVMGETVIDRVAYGTAFPLAAGQAAGLSDSMLDAVSNDDGANWCGAQSPMSGGDLGTPGVANGVCQ